MSRQISDNDIFQLSDAFNGSHHHVLRVNDPASDQVPRWRRVATVITENRDAIQSADLNDISVKEAFARSFAIAYVGEDKLSADYWSRTRLSWHKVVEEAHKMGLR